jgi:predicted nucleic acid-binding protein
MIIVDSSVLIDWLNDDETPETKILSRLLRDKQPIGINSIIEMEVLQGIRDGKGYEQIQRILSNFMCYHIGHETIVKASLLFRECQDNGFTPKSPDSIIAQSCIENDVPIFSKDVHFDKIAEITGKLKVYCK